MTFVRLIPEILIEVCVRNFLERLNIVDRNEVRVQIEELYINFFENINIL